MSIGFNKGKNFKDKKKIFSDINVTPFVDIVLVLLIIFMVTAPMMNTGFEVNLPKVSSNKVSMNKKEYVIFSVDKLGKIRVGEEVLSLKEVANYLRNYNVANTQIFIKGDKSSHYGAIIDLMALINKNGFTNLALVTDNLNE